MVIATITKSNPTSAIIPTGIIVGTGIGGIGGIKPITKSVGSVPRNLISKRWDMLTTTFLPKGEVRCPYGEGHTVRKRGLHRREITIGG